MKCKVTKFIDMFYLHTLCPPLMDMILGIGREEQEEMVRREEGDTGEKEPSCHSRITAVIQSL